MKEHQNPEYTYICALYRRANGDKTETVGQIADIRFVGAAFVRFVDHVTDLAAAHCDGIVPAGRLDGALALKIATLYGEIGAHIEQGHIREALDCLNVQVADAFAWLHGQDAPATRTQAVYNGVQLAVNLALLYEPFLPRTVQRLRERFGFGRTWQFSSVPAGTRIAAAAERSAT